ncbi:uncharacterized protein LOC126381667 isoform X2 [Pectinophora gossypiella]|uniref:uncharacterized protein LOC126381287 isoform X2 n=1 Tax=Pectinophora gossypiella TaxID=13191 RepID=UPI00214F4475|nr:uncharacterized protein LOC126381287 isoform X2 [Pectinophora gossypiella]XP_049887083.1 uncharacterized protein LOC126381667 isoform X2 [Pectinophora gossypiella]
MMKLHLIYLTLLSLSDAAFVSHMGLVNQNHNHNSNQGAINRVRASAFRPGVMLRPWTHPRLVQAASHRVPYVIYRNQPQRYAVKHYSPTRVFTGPWKASRPGAPVSAEYEFVRTASAPTIHTDGGKGAIHTIPAPNLSLSEKPIVVMDDHVFHHNIVTESPKIYEVTEKYLDHFSNSVPARIEKPIGFSKATSFTAPELHSLVKNGLQLSSDLGLSSIALPSSLQQQIHHHIQQQAAASQQNRLQQQQQQNNLFQQQQQQIHQNQHAQHQQNFIPHGIVPQQFSLQNLHNIQNNQEIVQAVPEGLVISPNALYQPDPAFLEKLQNQLLQRFPGVEFVPYPADLQPVQSQSIQSQVPAIHLQQVPQTQQPQQPQSVQPLQQHPQSSPLFLLQNEQIVKQDPPTFGLAENQNHKNVFLRETHEGNVVTLVPQIVVTNATEHEFEVTSASMPQNVTLELVQAESKPEATTVKYIIETTTEEQKTTPVFYTVSQSTQTPSDDATSGQNIANAQVVQSTGNVVTDSFYSGVNDIRAAAALAQVEKPEESTIAQENITTTLLPVPSSTIKADLKQYFVQQSETAKENKTTEIKPLLGVPFAKAPNSVAYTLVRSDDKETKVAKDGSVYAGQLVEASVSEDSDFNKEKAHLLNRRAPLRLVAVTRNKETTTTPAAPQKVTIVKARIPPKSKLTFDDKTGEPVLRIYASYVDNSAQKEATASKLANIKHTKEVVTRQQDTADKWRRPTVNALAKPHGFEPTQVTQFGLKLRSRSDSFSPLFDDYMV